MNELTTPQRLLLDKIFLNLFNDTKKGVEEEEKRFRFLKIASDDDSIARRLGSYIQSVQSHEDKYCGRDGFKLERAKGVQPAEGKVRVLQAIQSFCQTCGLEDQEGYDLFMEYFKEIPRVNQQTSERDVASHIAVLKGMGRSR